MKVHLRAPILRLFAAFSLAVCTLFVGTRPAAGQAHAWSHAFGGSGSDRAFETATDGAGNVLVTGSFTGTVDFGGGPLVSAGGTDIFVAKYDAAGAHLWSKRFGDVSTDVGNGIATDATGNVLVTGSFFGPIDFGGGVLVNAGNSETFVAKFDPNGNHLWSRRMGGIMLDRGLGVATDAASNVFVVGQFRDTADYGGAPHVSAGSDDIFLAKYDAAGAYQWSRGFGGTSVDYGDGVATDASGNVFMTGWYNLSIDFGGGALVSAGTRDVFLAKFDAAGSHLWSQRFGNTGTDECYGIATDGSGNVLITGQFQLATSFGGAALSNAGLHDIFLAKYDAAGAHVWSKRFGSSSQDLGRGIAIDPWGNVVITGVFNLGVNFGGALLTSAGSEDIYLAKYTAAGAHVWSQRFGGTGGDWSQSVATDATGSSVLAGYFQNAVDFGGGVLTSAGADDAVVAKYNEITIAAAFAGIWARPTGDGVRLTWDVTFDEPLDGFRVYRSVDGAPRTLSRELDATARDYVDGTVRPGETYVYTVTVVTEAGSEFVSPSVTVVVPAVATQLGQNHPNPFNPSTTIDYTLAENATVAIRIYDARGALVVSIEDGARPAGNHRVTWDGRDASGQPVSSGVYFYSLNAGKESLSRRMVLLK